MRDMIYWQEEKQRCRRRAGVVSHAETYPGMRLEQGKLQSVFRS